MNQDPGVERPIDDDLCWYCGVEKADWKSRNFVEFTKSKPKDNLFDIDFGFNMVEIPRCPACKQAHLSERKLTTALLVIAAAVGVAGLVIFLLVNDDALVGVLIGVGLFAVTYFILSRVVPKRRIPRLKIMKTTREHPQIKALLANGLTIAGENREFVTGTKDKPAK